MVPSLRSLSLLSGYSHDVPSDTRRDGAGDAGVTKLELAEKQNRNKPWRHFSYTRKGRMSWADWFTVRARAHTEAA